MDDLPRPDGSGGTFTVTIECGSGNEYDGRLGLRISAIFVILIGSLVGCLVPVLLSRQTKLRVPEVAFFIVRFFGSGVIIATAFIHLLAPSIDALHSPCLDPDSVITRYPWPEAICLMTVFVMLLAEMTAMRYAASLAGAGTGRAAAGLSVTDGEHGPSVDLLESGGPPGGDLTRASKNELGQPIEDGDEITPGKLDSLPIRLTTLFILEFGVVFHSVLIGLTLAVSGDEFVILYVVLVFHQTFEGLGLGSRFAVAKWPAGKEWLPYLLSVIYSLSTPVALAAGIGVRESLTPGSRTALVVMGIFDAISAGILLYTGLVGLIAHEFLSGGAAVQGRGRERSSPTFLAFGCMCLGAGLMALLGNWA